MNVKAFILLTIVIAYVARIEFLENVGPQLLWFSVIARMVMSLALASIIGLYGMYYIYLNNAAGNKFIYGVVIMLWALFMPLWLIGYDFEFMRSDRVQVFLYFLLSMVLVLFSGSLSKELINRIIVHEKKNGRDFPKKTPKSQKDLVGYHIAGVFFLTIPLLSKLFYH